MPNLRDFATLAALAGTAAGAGYTAFALARVRGFRAQRPSPAGPEFAPPVTIFKPLHGDEPFLYENLRSFCDQEYPRYQVIFGTTDAADPALEVARRLRDEFPQRDIAIVVGTATGARNPKVNNLIGMRERARYDLFVIADSDMHAGRDYLRTLVAPFAREDVGAVTCLYGGTSSAGLASRLGAMYVNDQFAPSVLVAAALEPLTYCFGATMAVRRDVLQRAGGFEALGEHLGDDYALGRMVTQAGYRVELSPYIVHTTVNDRNLRSLWLHELRWARTILAQRPAGYAGSIVTYVLPFAAALALLLRTPLGTGVLLAAAALRTALHYEARKTFAPHVAPAPWLIPLRDGLGVAVWAAAFLGRRVRWRDAKFSVEAGGHLEAWDQKM